MILFVNFKRKQMNWCIIHFIGMRVILILKIKLN